MKKKRPLSLAEIETACILLLVPKSGATSAEVTERLGLAPSMCPPVGQAMTTLRDAGLLDEHEDRWLLTDEGRSRLKEIGVTSSRSVARREATKPT